jgi:hypothetical protein
MAFDIQKIAEVAGQRFNVEPSQSDEPSSKNSLRLS